MAEYNNGLSDNYLIQKLHRVNLCGSLPKSEFEERLSELIKSHHKDEQKTGDEYKSERLKYADELRRFRYRDGLAVIDEEQNNPNICLFVDDQK